MTSHHSQPRRSPSVSARLGALFALSAACVLSTTATAQTFAAVLLPTDGTQKISRHAAKRAFAPRAVFIVNTTPARFVSSSEIDDESYDDVDDEFDAADLDHDGYISFREARRANPEWAKFFTKIDTSGDGYLTREEIDAFYRR